MAGTWVGAGALPPIGLGDLNSTHFKEPERIRGAAVQFEALLIQEMMKSGRAADAGWMGGEDQPGSVLGEMAEQQFAQVLASNGGLGIAKLVTTGLGSSDHAKDKPSFPNLHNNLQP